MRTPRKLYAVVSRNCDYEFSFNDIRVTSEEARELRDIRNDRRWGGAKDWRVEPFVKGD